MSTELRSPHLKLWGQEDSVNIVEESILKLWRQEDCVNRVEESIPEALEAGGQCQQSGGFHT